MKLNKLDFLFLAASLAVTLSSCGGETPVTVEHKISFNSNGGTIVEAIQAESASRITAPTNPTRNGYEFAGWYTDDTFKTRFQFSRMPNKDINLVAKWLLNNYTITYEVGDGQNNDNNPTMYNVLQNDIRLLEPTCENYFFAGWYTDDAYTTKVTSIDTSLAANIDLYAKWSQEEIDIVDEYTITYYVDGGTNGDNPIKFNKNQEDIKLNAPTKAGYNFAGWYTESSFSNLITVIDTAITTNLDLFAKWTKEEVTPPVVETYYTISYIMNGGSNGDNPVRYKEGDPSIELATPVKIGCTFKGWYADEQFTQPITAIDTSVNADIQVYAKWLDYISEVEYSIDIGIGREVVLYHISDTHINAGTTQSDLNSEANRVAARYGYANTFGEKYDEDYLFSKSIDGFKAIVNYVSTQEADAVCFTGDVMDYYSAVNCEFIKQEMPKVNHQYLYCLGNHETPASSYEDMIGMDTIDFTVLEFDDFEIVSLYNACTNSSGNYYYTEEQYEALKAETKKNKPIIIMEHVPIITKENCDTILEDVGSYFFIDENSCDYVTSKVVDLIVNDPNIKLVLCGHVHGGTYTYLAPGKPQITCSSALIGIINKITLY